MMQHEYDSNRRSAANCPCGKSNHDGKFSPFQGYTDKGYCFSCEKLFPVDGKIAKPKVAIAKKKLTPIVVAPTSYISRKIVQQSLRNYGNNTLIKFILELTDMETVQRILNEYYVGTSMYWKDSSVFWQIDFDGYVRGGKIIQYEITARENNFIGKNCNRVKTNKLPAKWIHKLLKIYDYKLKQCFFGEHLLKKYPDKVVGILESEKSCLIASAYHPEMLWLGSGGASGLMKKIAVLEGRKVILFPDLEKFEQWNKIAAEMKEKLKSITVKTSDLLERMATAEDRMKGLDLADYLIRKNWSDY